MCCYRNAMNSLLTKMGRCAFLLGTVSLGLSLITGCGSGTSSGGSTTPPVTGAETPTVTVTASPSGSISTAQALSVAVAVASSAGAPAGSVVLSSGNYASFPLLVSGGQAVVSVPAGLLAVGTDTLVIRRSWARIPSRLEAEPSLHPEVAYIEADRFFHRRFACNQATDHTYGNDSGENGVSSRNRTRRTLRRGQFNQAVCNHQI